MKNLEIMDYICEDINNNINMFDAINTFYLPYGTDFEYEIDRGIDPMFETTLANSYLEQEKVIEVEKTGLTVIR